MSDPLPESTGDPTIPSAEVATASSPGSPPASLARTVSFSNLNAKAPEFVPSPRGDPRLVITPPPPTLPAGMVHGYGAPNSPFPVAVQGQIPVQNHHFLQIHQQQQHVQYQHHQHQHQHHHHPQQRHNHNQKHHKQFHGGGEQDGVVQSQQVQSDKDHGNSIAELHNGLSKEACDKIINQVEYYFSDVNLATTDHLIKFINKDPEGYVPISVVASFKKIKAAISTNSQLAAVLWNSKKLVVSDDGKKVKRLQSLTGSDMEELQARIILAENLPEDYSHQNLMKIFSAVGSVKSIRTCQPQASNTWSATSRSSKAENMLYSNKVHAFVEYDSVELAEKAIAELNDEGDWRNGLRVRLLPKHTSKSVQARGKKVGNDVAGTCEEDGTSTSEQDQLEKQADVSFRQSDTHSNENLGEEHEGEKGGQKKGRNHGRGSRGRGRGHQHQANHAGSTHVGTLISNSISIESASSIAKNHHPPGPRMPDGTRGFSMGRGKPLLVNTSS
ncbi:hypothetical protein Dimus_000527 [Dionaea muscipula]